ncbi:MAG: hypothetical protein HWE27_03605 [Gammaproteobacteria bacterium]|nr:hypothetical protein [Gammaproteobacteria bacterium]
MRVLFALVGGALAVVLITLIAVGIYGLFPDSDEVIPVTPIILDDVLSESDYKIEGLECECKSQQLEYERQITKTGLGCKASVLSIQQLQDLPECDFKRN